MSTIQYLPCIRVINLLELDTPIKVTLSSRDDDTKMWWKFAPCIPSLVMDPRSSVTIVGTPYPEDRFKTYLLSQTFFTIYMYNKLSLDDPLKYYIDDDGFTFYYFIAYGEVLAIPLLMRHPMLNVLLSNFDHRPVLKISVNNQT